MVLHQLNTDKQKIIQIILDSYFVPYKKINLKWTISLNVNYKTEISRKKTKVK